MYKLVAEYPSNTVTFEVADNDKINDLALGLYRLPNVKSVIVYKNNKVITRFI